MDEVQHFTYGWINPTFAYILSVVGSLLGLVCTARARTTDDRRQRAWLLVLAACAIGGTGIWVMHFMAMIGFSVPGAVLRYDVPLTIASFLIAVIVVGAGLFIVGHGEASRGRLLFGGTVTGVSVAFMHYTGMAAMHLNGRFSFDVRLVVASYAIAVVAATVALWCTLVVSGAKAIGAASSIMGLAVCGMHYTGMAAIRVDLHEHLGPIPGVQVNWFLAPIVLFVLLIAVVAVTSAMLAIPADELARTGAGRDAELAGRGSGGGPAFDRPVGPGSGPRFTNALDGARNGRRYRR